MAGGELKALRDRLRAASEPDPELDALLWAEFDDRDVRYANGMMLAKSRKAPHDECVVGFVDPGKVARNFSWSGQFVGGAYGSVDHPRPALTASVDLSLALCERKLPEWQGVYMTTEWTGYTRPGNGVRCSVTLRRGIHSYIEAVSGDCPTLPLAILIALLGALIEEEIGDA